VCSSYFECVPSPVKHPEKTDMMLFRENTEDIYAGIEFMGDSLEAKKIRDFLSNELKVDYSFDFSPSIGIKPVSEKGSKRLIRAANEYALKNKKKTLALVHKGNIMKFTEGAFKNWGYELVEEEYADRVITWEQYKITKKENSKEFSIDKLEEASKAGTLIITIVIADIFIQLLMMNTQYYTVNATLNLND